MRSFTDAVEVGVNGRRSPFAEGVARLGDLELEVRSSDLEGGRHLELVVRNPGRRPVALHDVTVRLDGRPELVLEQGFQGSSVVRRCPPGDVRPERAGLPAPLLARCFARPESAGRLVAGDQVLVTCDGVAGFLGARRHLGTVEAGGAGLVLRAMFDGVELGRGEVRTLEPAWVGGGPAGPRYSDFASLWGLAAGARIATPAPVGWTGRHHYGDRLTPDALASNLKLAADRGLELVQLDGGYHQAVGDWLDPAPGWPGGSAPVADEVRAAGLRAGVWTAPFAASRGSRLVAEHAGWTAVDGGGRPVAVAGLPGGEGDAVVLDTTRPDVLDHLRSTFAALSAQGFDYFTVDACYAACLPARRHDPGMTRAEALWAGLRAVREGIGPAAFLVAAGCPLGPAAGTADAVRVAPETAPTWSAGPASAPGWPGMAEAAPAAVNAAAAAVLRSPLHRRVFVNDPDCLLLRPTATGLGAGQRAFLAAVVTGTGAFSMVSDDLGLYSEAEWDLLDAMRSVHSDVDTLLDLVDPFSDPVVVVSAAGTRLTVDWRPGGQGPRALLGTAG